MDYKNLGRTGLKVSRLCLGMLNWRNGLISISHHWKKFVLMPVPVDASHQLQIYPARGGYLKQDLRKEELTGLLSGG